MEQDQLQFPEFLKIKVAWNKITKEAQDIKNTAQQTANKESFRRTNEELNANKAQDELRSTLIEQTKISIGNLKPPHKAPTT